MPAGQGSVQTYDGSGGAILESIARDVVMEAGLVANRTYPFLASLLAKPTYLANSTKIELHDYQLRVKKWTTVTGAQDTTGDTTITFTSTDGLTAGTILTVEGTQEALLVTAVASNQATVTRGYGGTTKATIPSGTNLHLAGTASLEGAAFADTGGHTPDVWYNYLHIINKGFEVSGTMQSLDLVAAPMGVARNQVSIEENMAVKEAVDDLAFAVMNSVAPASTTQGSASVRRTMNGLIEIVREGAAASKGALYTDIASTDFNATTAFENLLTHIKNYWDNGGTGNTIVVNSRIKRQLDIYLSKNGRRDANLTMVRANVMQFDTSFGQFELMLDVTVPVDKMVIADMSKIRLVSLPGRQFRVFPIAKVGDSQRWMLNGEYSLEVISGRTGSMFVGYNAAA